MSIERKFGRGVAWMAAGNWVEQVINFLVFVLLARILGAETFGLLAMAAAFVLLCEFLVRESFSDFLISFANPDDEHFNTTFWVLAGLGLLLSLTLILAAGPISDLYGQSEVRGLIVALSPTVMMIALTAVPVAILRRELRFRTLSLRAIAGVIAGGVVAIYMALNGFGIWSLAGQRLAQVLTNIVMAWAAVNWRPRFSISKRHLREVGGFGGAVLGLRAAELASTQLPSVIIGATLGPLALGFYSIAWRLVEIGSFLIVTPLRMASQPAFAEMQRKGGAASKLLIDISRLSGLVAFPAFAGLAILAQPILALLFGPGWGDAAPILSILSVLGAYLCIEKIHQAYCLALGRAGATTLVAWAEVVLGAVLVWVLVPWGVNAMAAGLVASFLLFWGLRFYIVAGVAGLSPWVLLKNHLLPITGAILMAGLIWILLGELKPQSLLQVLLISIGAGILFFGGFTAIFMRNRLGLLKSFIAKPGNSDDTTT